MWYLQNPLYNVAACWNDSYEAKQVAIVTAGGLLRIHSSHSSDLKAGVGICLSVIGHRIGWVS